MIMREILFKGKRIDNGEWIEGYYCPCVFGRFPCRPAIIIKEDMDNGHWHPEEIIPSTIGQYTGLTDKNGKKIFEGDVVNFKTTAYFFKNCRINYESQFARFCAIDNKGYEYPMDKTFNYEIIGNVFDNPELLRSDTE